jgi:hypothetical protein
MFHGESYSGKNEGQLYPLMLSRGSEDRLSRPFGFLFAWGRVFNPTGAPACVSWAKIAPEIRTYVGGLFVKRRAGRGLRRVGISNDPSRTDHPDTRQSVRLAFASP